MKSFPSLPLPAAHVLIVDGSAEEQHLLKEMLRGNDFHLSVAAEGREAYDQALQSRPDMILMNLQTPGLDAFAMERMLRENPLTEDVSVLFYATVKHLSGIELADRSEILDYLIKPFTVGQLVERVQAQLRLSLMLRETRGARREGARSGNRGDWDLVRRAKKHMEERLPEIRRLADIAEALAVSERRLGHAFQGCLNMSVAEYMRQERMRKAKYLLTHTTLSIRAIAATVGFSSAANFSTAFNSWVGASPSSFRNQALTNALALDRVLGRQP
ncbi:response regulator receiver domain-containing protein [Pusillimonas noertemannii]|uniref:Response regulator receiver domain-containing protein n=1 Tax=Pusillimonas noertemannii TaxID=305977 RepID=A0A2U1CRZ9_9BURK|nr:response regulator receiver domain-containing protein [Pusillimonas noertemannii]